MDEASANLTGRVPFFIWFLERSGSTHLVSLLDSHPEIVCHHELFHESVQERDGQRTIARHDEKWPDAAVSRKFLDALYMGPGAAGFKLKMTQRQLYPEVWDYLEKRHSMMRVIVLVRRNLLKCTISKVAQLLLHRIEGESNLKMGQPRKIPRRVTVEPAWLLRWMQRREREDIQLRQAALQFPNRLEVVYEDLLADESYTCARVLRFLGASTAVTVRSGCAKLMSDRLEDALENYGEVARALRGTRFEKYLDDGAPTGEFSSAAG